MKHFLTGGALSAFGLFLMWALDLVHPALPFVFFGCAAFTTYCFFLREMLKLVRSGEYTIPGFRGIFRGF